MQRWILRFAIVIAVVLVAWLLRVTVLAPDPLEVRVATAERGLVEETVTNSRAGTIRARRRAKLSPEVGGQVIELPFRESDTVNQGDVLLRLDARTQEARLVLRRRELEAARAEENRACVAADRARREMNRVKRLADEAIVSVDLLDQAESGSSTAKAACEAARAQTARARAAESLAQTELSKTVLHAPFAGVVAEVTVELGEWSTPSPPAMPIPAVLDILDPTSMYVSAPMDEVDSARIKVGQAVRITVDSHRGRSFLGSITRVAPYVLDIQEQNRTVEVEAEFDDADFAATTLPGTSADLEVILQAKSDSLRIPTAALLEGNRTFVLEDGVLRERRLEIGVRNWNYTEVVGGLEAGAEVVTSLDQVDIEDGIEAIKAAHEEAY